MLYLALTFWLLVIVWIAWGVHCIWSGMIAPKLLNAVLLPGTLVAQLGHVLGLLITGATVSNTTLYKDDDSGAPETTTDPKPRIPVVGPVVIGMLPLLACGTAVYFVSREFGKFFLTHLPTVAVGPKLPTSLAGFWQMLRDQISLVESLVSVTMTADLSGWKSWLFIYLLICLTIRIAPFSGNLRGSLVAIIILGLGAALVSSLVEVGDPRVQHGWSVINLTVAALYFLLLVSLVVRGGVGLVRVLRSGA